MRLPDFTPTTEQVRAAYAHDPEGEYRDPVGFPAMRQENLQAFDRRLAAHDAEVSKEAGAAVAAIFTEAPVVGRAARVDRTCGLDEAHEPHAYLYLQNHPERVTECKCGGRA